MSEKKTANLPVGIGRGAGSANGEKPQVLWPTIRRLLGYMKRSWLLVILTFIVAIAGTVMQVINPKLLGNATTLIFSSVQAQSDINFSGLTQILFMVAALYVGVFVMQFLQERMMTLVAHKTVYVLRNELKAKMNRVPIRFFDQHANGNLMSVAANDIDNIVNHLQQSLTAFITSIVTVVGTLSFMFFISWQLTLLALVMIPGSMLVMKLFTPQTQKNNKKYMQSMGALNTQIEESYQGFAVIKSMNGEAEALRKFAAENEAMYQSGWRAKFFGGSMMPTMLLVQNIIYVLICGFGAVSVVSGRLLIGDMQAFLQYSGQFTSPVSKLSMIWSSLLAAVASAERVFRLLDAEEAEQEDDTFANQDEKAKVVFDRVQFGYTETPLMNDFSLQVTDGQMVAIVGHTGAGKTTLISLLERFYEIQGGGIRVEGIDIRNLPQHELRKRIGMVLQDTWLFSGTIYENIKFGNENATDAEIYAAAAAAYADDFIQKLPDGYHTVLSEDAGNLSQGQRQLITIARAFVANPDILILDEATSNVDSRTERVIQQAMRKLLQGRTSFVVAHRLSTIYEADNIIVMDKGDIAETGTHTELMVKNGTYAEIYNSQFAAVA